MQTWIHACMHANVQTHTWPCICLQIHTYIHINMHTCAYICVCVCHSKTPGDTPDVYPYLFFRFSLPYCWSCRIARAGPGAAYASEMQKTLRSMWPQPEIFCTPVRKVHMFLHHFEISSRSDDKTELQPTKNRKDKKDTKRLVVLDFIFLSGRHVAGLGSFSASILSGPREIEYLFLSRPQCLSSRRILRGTHRLWRLVWLFCLTEAELALVMSRVMVWWDDGMWLVLFCHRARLVLQKQVGTVGKGGNQRMDANGAKPFWSRYESIQTGNLD